MNLSTYEMDLRERCIGLALRHPDDGMDTVVRARSFYAFITGEDEKTPRERILQAMEEAGVR